MECYKQLSFVRNNNLIDELVVVDGIGLSGKGMMAQVLSSMLRVEKQNNAEFFEYIPILYNCGKIDRDAAIAVLRTQGDTILYNTSIGREVNFRPSDYTGVLKNAYPFRYFRRLFMSDGSAAVVRIKQERPILSICTHDGLRSCQLLFEAFPKLKIIYMLRDPVDLIKVWSGGDFHTVGNFDKRIGIDPREFQYTIKYEDHVVPYSALGWEEEYLSITSMEKIVRLIDSHFSLNIGNYCELISEQKDSINMVCFEEFVTKPLQQCDEIASFLGTKTTPRLKKILKREHCPRTIKKENREKHIAEIEKQLSSKYKDIFNELIKKYDSRYWS